MYTNTKCFKSTKVRNKKSDKIHNDNSHVYIYTVEIVISCILIFSVAFSWGLRTRSHRSKGDNGCSWSWPRKTYVHTLVHYLSWTRHPRETIITFAKKYLIEFSQARLNVIHVCKIRCEILIMAKILRVKCYRINWNEL